MRFFEPEITPGSYWVCKPESKVGLTSHSIFAKILSVKEDNVHFIRKSAYGFLDLSPNSLKVNVFLEYYMRLED